MTSHRGIAIVNLFLYMFVLHKTRISVEFDSRQDLQPIKLEQRLQMLLKLSFRKMCDSK